MMERVSTLRLPVSRTLFNQKLVLTSQSLVYKFPKVFENFCELLEDPIVKSVPELIEFNNKNAAHAMPERKFKYIPPEKNRY
jgi:amidase